MLRARGDSLSELLAEGGLILAGHPDDEVIGAGGLLQRSTGWHVLYLTDGAPRDRRFWPQRAPGSREAYATLRWREALSSLAVAGVEPSRVAGLGLADQEAACSLSRCAGAIARWLVALAPPALLVQPYEGGHPDHDAAAFAARAALALLSRVGVRPLPVLIEMTSYHRSDGGLATGRFLGESRDEVVLPLSPQEAHRKAAMLARHESQQQVLAAFHAGAPERFRVAPACDFTAAPHPGSLQYELLGFEMTGEHWRALARAAAAELELADAPCPSPS